MTQMFEQFTEKSIKALRMAEDEARKTGHDSVGTEHILVGLLREGTGNAAKSLKSLDLTLKEVRLEVGRVTSRGRGTITEWISYSEAAKRALGAAVRETQSIGADYIATEYLLLGLLADNSYENRALRVLEHFRINLTDLSEQVTRTAVAESVLYRRPPTERPRKRQPQSDEMVYQALIDTLTRARAEGEDEAANNRMYKGLAEIVKSLRKARDVAISEHRIELAAWIGMQEQNLIQKIQDRGDNVIDVGKMLALGKFLDDSSDSMSNRNRQEFRRISGFNTQALHVPNLAKEESHKLGRNYVGTEHLLLGLIAEDPGPVMTVTVTIGGRETVHDPRKDKDFGIAAKVFKSMGVTLEGARAEVEKILGPGTDVVMEEPPLTARAERIFDLSREEAQRLFPEASRWQRHVGTEHLLLALIREIDGDKDDVANKTLANLGVDLNKLKEEILRLEPDARLLTSFVADKVITLAKEETRRLGYDLIGAEQILLGMIGEGIGIASRSLKLVGVNIDDARAELEAIIGRGPGSTTEDLSFAPSTRKLFELARIEAKQIGHAYLGTEHLMLAMINQNDDAGTNTAMKVLRNLKIDIERLRYEVTSRLYNCITKVEGENFLK